MKRIWKYAFEVEDFVRILMPKGSEVLHVDVQRGDATIWVLANPDNPKEERTFRIVGTGNPFPDANDMKYIATFQQPPFVWHVFEPKHASEPERT